MRRDELLDEAKKTICHDRNDQYGNPEESFSMIAELWTAYWNHLVTFEPSDVADMMGLLKIARNATGGRKEDNYIDLAGYAACGCELMDCGIPFVEVPAEEKPKVKKK